MCKNVIQIDIYEHIPGWVCGCGCLCRFLSITYEHTQTRIHSIFLKPKYIENKINIVNLSSEIKGWSDREIVTERGREGVESSAKDRALYKRCRQERQKGKWGRRRGVEMSGNTKDKIDTGQ